MSVPVVPALAHDYLLVMRGAERVFAAMAGIWPESPIYTALYDREGTGGRFDGRDITTSYLQRLPVGQASFRRLLPLYPRAVERLPTDQADLIVSSSSAFAIGVPRADDAVHVCYCHSPFRYAWHERERALAEVPSFARRTLGGILDRVREWDVEAASRITRFIAVSEIGRRRIGDFYGRDAAVIHPPVELERFAAGQPGDRFLMVGELVRHKQVDVALEAAEQAGVEVDVAGTGPEQERLASRFDRTARFLGRVGDSELARLYAGARAVIVPSVEEFGIVAVEAQASGRPVVAAGAGGALETVVDGETGVLVPPRDPEAMADALRETDFGAFDPAATISNAERFGPERFARELLAEVRAAT